MVLLWLLMCGNDGGAVGVYKYKVGCGGAMVGGNWKVVMAGGGWMVRWRG